MWAVELTLVVVIGALGRLTGEIAARSRKAWQFISAVGVGLAFLILLASLLFLLRGVNDVAWRGIGASIGILLALWPAYRRLLSRVVPIDDTSPLDTLGLAAIQALIGFAVTALVEPSAVPALAITGEQLLGQAVAEVLLAAILVGFPWRRNATQVLERLGLRRLSVGQLLGATGFTIALFFVAGAAGLMANLLQPGVVERIQERMLPLASEFGSPWRALELGLLAGIGEEVLFRGAIQPRYGLLLTALLFTVVHVQYELSLVTLGVFGVAILLGLERRWLGTSACIVTHALYNALAIALQHGAVG